MNRRNLLTGMGMGAIAILLNDALAPVFAFAGGRPRKNFVLIKLQNGWDVTLGLDPRTHDDGTDQDDIFLEYTGDQIIDAGPMRFGPAAAALKPFASNLAVINGVAMAVSDTGHQSSLTYISTGNGRGAAPDLPVEIAAGTTQGLLGVVSDSLVSTLGRNIRLTTMDSLTGSGDQIDPASYLDYLRRLRGRRDFTEAAIVAGADPVTKNRLVAEIQKRSAVLAALGGSGLDNNEQSMRRSGILLSAAFAAEAAFQGQIATNFDLDTHSNHEKNHLSEQAKAWKGVADIFKEFQAAPAADGSGSLWDQTVFMVVSEFARTPTLNAVKGKDHNPFTNSVLLAGGPIPQVTIGASAVVKRSARTSGASVHAALPVDFATGQVALTREQATAKNYSYIQPENIVNTIAEIVGVDRKRFQSVAEATPTLKTLLK